MPKPKILIVDDEKDILSILTMSLLQEGYEVFACYDSTQALSIAKKNMPDIIILDVMMPKKNGYELCEQMRQIDVLKDKYIFFLTALNDENNHIKGLSKGADDFLTKPISLKILKAKIQKIIDKKQITQKKQDFILDFGKLKINAQEYHIEIQGKSLHLPKKEFELLYFLATKKGNVVQRDKILNDVWGQDVVVNDRTIDVHIRKIRKKIHFNCIHTIKGVGYKFDI